MLSRIRVGLIVAIVGTVTLVLMPVQMLALKFRWRLRLRLPVIWHRMVCWLLGVRIHLRGQIDTRRPLLLVSNHASWLDIVVMGAIGELCFVAKSDMKSWPVFGFLAKMQSTIFVEREEKRKTGAQVNEISDRLSAGETVVLFPEGTTSDGNALLDFKSSLFGAASSAVPASPTGMVHVQPVAIAYTGVHGMPMGRYHRPLVAWPGDVPLVSHLVGVLKEGAIDVIVGFGESVDFNAQSNRKHVARTAELRIRALLRTALHGRPPENPDAG